MNARDNIKPKTIRLAILLALADGAITTIDDLQIRMDEPRKKVVDNAVHAANDDLIKRLRDDVTGGPAYQITPKGREHLASFAGGKAEVAADLPTCAESQTDAITPGVKVEIPAFPVRPVPATDDLVIGTVFPSDIAVKDAVIANLQKRWDEALAITVELRAIAKDREDRIVVLDAMIAQVRADRSSSDRMFQAAVSALASISVRLDLDPDEGGAEPILSAIDQNESDRSSWRDECKEWRAMAAVFGCTTPGQIADRISGLDTRVATFNRGPALVGYVIQRAGKPLVRVIKAEKAEARALSFARGGKRAQVFGLVPAGAAVPGAEWVEAE